MIIENTATFDDVVSFISTLNDSKVFVFLPSLIKENEEIIAAANNSYKPEELQILQEIQNALRLVEDTQAIDLCEIRDHQLTEAEGNFIKYLKLNPLLSTGGFDNDRLIGSAYYGLFLIEITRKNYIEASLYILKTYIEFPFYSRTHFCQQLFSKFMAPLVEDLIEAYNQQVKMIPTEGEKETTRKKLQKQVNRQYWGKLSELAVTTVMTAAVALFPKKMGISHNRSHHLTESGGRSVLKLGKQLKYLSKTVSLNYMTAAELDQQLIYNIDDRTRKISNQILKTREQNSL